MSRRSAPSESKFLNDFLLYFCKESQTLTLTTSILSMTGIAGSNWVAYDFEEKPEWRKESVTTSSMLQQITRWRKEYQGTVVGSKALAQWKVDYVQDMNFGEDVGTQTREDTEAVLKKTNDYEGSDQRWIETINISDAIAKFEEVQKDMDKSGLITVQQISSVHRQLLTGGLHREPGEIRKTKVYTTWENKIHYYPAPESVEELMYSLIDRHNACISLPPQNKESEEYTAFIFKCAARLMFEFVSIHPFGDGNGRTCRLLAKYIINLITPFSVSPYCRIEESDGRERYISAIVRCRNNPSEGPRELAAMLVEGAWRGYRTLFSSINES